MPQPRRHRAGPLQQRQVPHRADETLLGTMEAGTVFRLAEGFVAATECLDL